MRLIHFLYCIIFFFFSIPSKGETLDQKIDMLFTGIATQTSNVIFYSVYGMPLIVLWLFIASIIFTIYFKFINFSLFKLAIQIVSNKFDSGKDAGEVSHFQALATALSGTIGLGNIAGIAAAISLGGPGATFWIVLTGLFSMTSKFVECTLGVHYREIDSNGTVYGGPMYYLSKGLKELNLKYLGKVLAVVFAIFCILGSFGGGNMFQANQSYKQLASVPFLRDTFIINHAWFFGLIMALLVGLVIIGGIKSIARVTDKLVPAMAILYIGSSLYIITLNYESIIPCFQLILKSAFKPEAALGGFIGVMMTGIKRASFSNEAGIGSASIAHAAVKTKYPSSEGIVSLLEPFIDTVVICTMTGLVILITNTHQTSVNTGISLTSDAFASQFFGAEYILLICALLFAFSTIISWSYYGLNAWEYLFGKKSLSVYMFKLIFCSMIIIGASSNMNSVIDFSDCMILAMSFPNIIGLYFLAPKVKYLLNHYVEHINNLKKNLILNTTFNSKKTHLYNTTYIFYMNNSNSLYYNRIHTLDVIRGIAILGILLINIVGFGLHRAYYDPTNAGGSTGWDLEVWWYNNLLIEGTMRGILSIVFGASIILFSNKTSNDKGLTNADCFYRKMIWLFIFGMIHAYLFLWYGDILYPYAIVGFFAYSFRNWSSKKLIIGSLLLATILTLLNFNDYYQTKKAFLKYQSLIKTQRTPSSDSKKIISEWHSIVKKKKSSSEELSEANHSLRKGYLNTVWYRSTLVQTQQTNSFYRKYFLDIFSMVLLGMALLKNGLLIGKKSIKFYILFTVSAYTIGVGINYWESYFIVWNDFSILSFSLTDITSELGRIPTAIGHIGLIVLIIKLNIFKKIQEIIANVGKMSLSNYFLQTLCCIIIFMDFGFNLFGKLYRHELYYIVVAIWALQLLISNVWLYYFNLGPLEWLLKSLMYGKKISNNKVFIKQ